MYPMFGYFDPTMILVLIGAALSMAASAKVKGTFSKYSSVRSASGMTGAEAARRLLQSQGIFDVSVEPIRGDLTDHYDPRSKVLRLSESVYNQKSIAAIGVAAHECGHAIQDNVEYAPLKFRGALVPVANIGAQISWPMILIGLFIGMYSNSSFGPMLMQLGILCFSLAVLFQLVTLPVELNASNRAMKLLDANGILAGDELQGTKKVLSAAALTYVAALAASVLQLLRLIILFGGRRNDD